MTINTEGKWWVGNGPADIEEYLQSYTQESHPISTFALSQCSCSSLIFNLDFDGNEGVAKRTCTQCAAEHFICDSEEYWQEAEPEPLRCPDCGSDQYNVGVGFSLYEAGEAKGEIRWLYVGVRCVGCGVLGSCTDWKIAYAPSTHLIDAA